MSALVPAKAGEGEALDHPALLVDPVAVGAEDEAGLLLKFARHIAKLAGGPAWQQGAQAQGLLSLTYG